VTRVAVVSGGGTGIGKAIAARLAAGGDQVVIIGRRPEVLAAAAQELTAAGPGRVSWCAADLTRPQDVERAAAGVGGTVDVVVNNAGGVASRGMPDGRLAEVARAWEADYQANVISAVLLTQALLSRLRRTHRSRGPAVDLGRDSADHWRDRRIGGSRWGARGSNPEPMD
jgi:3-oxoacyl-[acyl-carrier protein] reductase